MKRLFLLFTIALAVFSAQAKRYQKYDAVQKAMQRATTYISSGKHKRALELYQDILNERKDLPEVYFNLGKIYSELKQHAQAANAFQSTLSLNRRYPKAALCLAKEYEYLDQKDSALKAYEQALEPEPNNPAIIIPLAKLYDELDDLDASLELLKRGAASNDNNNELLMLYANTLNTALQSEAALAIYQKLEDRMPQNAYLLNNLGYSHRRLNNTDEAIRYYRKACEITRSNHNPRLNLGLALLSQSNPHPDDWTEAWGLYEYRLFNTKDNFANLFPLLTNDDVKGKTLLLVCEQGLGDTFQFIRYAQEAKEAGAQKIVVAAQNPLQTILKLCPYIDQVIRLSEQPPACDAYVKLMSMPNRMRTTLETVPCKTPYLYAAPDLIELWKEKLSTDTNFKIGVCWQGNPDYGNKRASAVANARCVNVTDFIPLMQIPGVSVYSLQQADGMDQLALLPADASLVTFSDDFDRSHGAFMDTAAVMKNLDLIITVDTSVCHLAGGLGVPTWTMLQHAPDWRWMLDREDSPWYPTMKLFRQESDGDWSLVIQNIINSLMTLFEEQNVQLAVEQTITTEQSEDNSENNPEALGSQEQESSDNQEATIDQGPAPKEQTSFEEPIASEEASIESPLEASEETLIESPSETSAELADNTTTD